MFMIHPEHGANIVNTVDVARHIENGWKESTPEEWIASKKPKESEQELERAQRGPGRPRKE